MLESLIIEDYKNGISMKKIAEKNNCSYTKIRNLLINNKIKLRSKTFKRSDKDKIHNIDVNYFNKIDTSEKAYWLGIISSDGTISKDGYKVSLSSKDLEIIENFKFCIKSSHKISEINQYDKRTKKYYKRYMIQVSSKDFVKDIKNKGITHNKSYISLFPNIDKCFYKDFIRGLYDGDGSITRKSNKNIRISFISSKEIIINIQEYFNNIGLNSHPIYNLTNKMNIYRTHYFSESKNILDHIYESSTHLTRLSRKYLIYLNKL